MATTFTVTNVEKHPDGSPWVFARVKLTLADPTSKDSDGNQLTGTSWGVTDASGAVSFTGLAVGVVYVWTAPSGQTLTFMATAAGTFTLMSKLVGYVPAGTAAVSSQQLADAIAAQATADSSHYVPAPAAGTTPGFVPTVGSDGHTVTYAAASGGSGLSVTDNGDGTGTFTPTGSTAVTDNGDGTGQIAA